MKYIGSKKRISKYILPILQGYIDKNNISVYYEPFVGGSNMIDEIKFLLDYSYVQIIFQLL